MIYTNIFAKNITYWRKVVSFFAILLSNTRSGNFPYPSVLPPFNTRILTVLLPSPYNKKSSLVGYFLRRKGDSNPRYSYPYDSLANCWFQPLTHLSFLPCEQVALTQSRNMICACPKCSFLQKRGQRYCFFLMCANVFAKKTIFIAFLCKKKRVTT